MKILVTGGVGFIGSAFVRNALKQGNEIVVVDCLTYAGDVKRLEEFQNQVKFYCCDITNKDQLTKIFQENQPEGIVHWAAETHVDRSILNASPFMTTNVIGTQNLLDLARKFPVKKFINIATDEVYGELDENGEFTEHTPLCPNSPYSVSKTSADMLGRAYFRTYNIPVVTLRPSNNYGPWQYPEKLVPVIIHKALHGEDIPVYGKGLNVREWLYMDDCAGAALKALFHAEPGSIYNVGSAQERTNIEVVNFILREMDQISPRADGESYTQQITYVQDRPGHDFRYALNFDKIQKELHWKPEVLFEEGMKKTVKWNIENREWIESKAKDLQEYWKQVYRPVEKENSL